MIEEKITLPYSPEEIKKFFAYDYEWIDELSYTKRLDNVLPDYKKYEREIIEKFLSIGWSGEGEINTIWIPPFLIAKIAKYGEEAFLQRFNNEKTFNRLAQSPNSWTRGLILWHVKQKEDGISFICSPIELNIPSYALS
ncbi:hypothetical protein QRO11_05320 [Paracidovorax citrulli]|uniref:hypothetical protein n=1 Tax=Paracidovorax citrulli TaxID=80869 RepID=UPI000A83B521|nr:hypothetical protein [Paracidovorax citrulli]UEG47249.1 hypothetical protein LKW27_05075 [Paracidovorax citrulli]UMT89475.1 hypothetical protein FRC90_16330 [Paracidovorax citrulli]UMT95803.1 hypothetical protein FRC97_12735 [Paracidovorax citrulli]WIY35761.1 hypothetical protein QRO11_05320 [Paracidovorax citrulli]